MLLPLLSPALSFPLAAIFSHQAHHIQSIGNSLVSDLVAYDAITPGASGADINIYRRVSWAPFLQRKVQGARYFNTQCDASAAFAKLLPDGHHLRMICPATTRPHHRKMDTHVVVKLY